MITLLIGETNNFINSPLPSMLPWYYCWHHHQDSISNMATANSLATVQSQKTTARIKSLTLKHSSQCSE